MKSILYTSQVSNLSGTHLVDGLVSPTGKKIATDYVYVIQFTTDKISHMTKIWHA